MMASMTSEHGGRLGVVAILVAIASIAACTPKPRPSATPAPTVAPTVTAAAVLPSPSAAASGTPSAEPSNPPSTTPIAGGWTFVKSGPCPDSDFECITLAVPRDHFVANSPTWEVTFGILRATGKKQGTFVTANGGPGYSGLSAADSYTERVPGGRH